jgi:hypothetical protein
MVSSCRTIAASSRPRATGTSRSTRRASPRTRYDGLYVLRTNAKLNTLSVALAYRQLWKIEAIFRTAKAILETRPIYHQCDAAIADHLLACSSDCSELGRVADWRRHDTRLLGVGTAVALDDSGGRGDAIVPASAMAA